MPSDVESAVYVYAAMLLGAAILGIVAWRLHLPYAVALVLGGLAVEESHVVALPQLNPPVLLFVFLPPLLFDAAFRLDDVQLRSLARPVLWLAVFGTIATAALVGLALFATLHLPLAEVLLFGSIVSATDPVAVVGVFRGLSVSRRLEVLVEGESLINDGVAITLYTAAIGLATSGNADLPSALGLFVREVVGGVAIGAVLGVLFSRITAIIDDHLIEMTLSTALAYGSYLVAQSVETSGALACVAAGLIHGSYGRQVGMSERTRRLLDDLWEYFGFVVNAVVFLLVGFTTNLAALEAAGGPVLVSIASVLFSRVLVILIPPQLLRLTRRIRAVTSKGEQAVLIWGGLRGALTITLALALPPSIADRQLLVEMAFGVVLFTLVVQGMTLSYVIRRAGLAESK
ncbi:MAG: sodium:proton antiporter [Chloroflexi bacterium]|nr:sodium:proton antiporter [Chloroflexota bacterium]MBV9600997.1 sodium:proton antiporter [Chloroflexota bacterium]